MALKGMGISVRQTGEVDVLDTIDVGAVMTDPPVVAAPADLLVDVEARLNEHHSHGAPVVDGDRLVGLITMSDIVRFGSEVVGGRVEDAMTSRPATVTPSTPVSRALERMAALGVGRLPVVAEDEPFRLEGLFRREDAVRAYHEALTTATDVELHRARLAQRTDPGAGYYDFRVPPGSIADGKSLREVSWPEESTLVSVRRGREVIVPGGDTVLIRGDVVTAFGTATSKSKMIERLNAGAMEATAEISLAEIQAQSELMEGEDPGEG